MKRYRQIILIALLCFFAGAPSVYAQYKSVVMGARVSPNFGWFRVDTDDYNSEGIVPGIGWGLTADFYFAENYAIASGFNVNFINAKLSYPDVQAFQDGIMTRKYRLKYIEIPVLVKMKTNDIGDFRFFGQLGLQPGVRIASKGKDSFTSNAKPIFTSKTDWHGIDSETNLFRISMVVGAGIEYPIDNSTALVAGINFVNGLSDVLKGKNALDNSIKHKAIPNMLELSVGIVF
ncbi:MAG TPA: outer membrane beta-barrel protein [Lentimicrobium sp.]|jgi:hypothetical protein|nr:outer membrane beta-barrel protein [Lentimicrobium sp.]